MKKIAFLSLLLAAGIFMSCTKEDSIYQNKSNDFVAQPKATESVNSQDEMITYLESSAFRNNLDNTISIAQLNEYRYNLDVDMQTDVIDVIQESGPYPSWAEDMAVIKITITNDPNLPNGIYMLDLCNGNLMNILGNSVGTAAGTYGC